MPAGAGRMPALPSSTAPERCRAEARNSVRQRPQIICAHRCGEIRPARRFIRRGCPRQGRVRRRFGGIALMMVVMVIVVPLPTLFFLAQLFGFHLVPRFAIATRFEFIDQQSSGEKTVEPLAAFATATHPDTRGSVKERDGVAAEISFVDFVLAESEGAHAPGEFFLLGGGDRKPQHGWGPAAP